MPDRLSRYSFYITTNSNKTVLYCGVTNNLEQRLMEHFLGKVTPDTFTGKYYCYWLVYYEIPMYDVRCTMYDLGCIIQSTGKLTSYIVHRTSYIAHYYDSGFPTAINGLNAVNALRISHFAAKSKKHLLPPAPFKMTASDVSTQPGNA